jgi:predicted aldo/keto reductase-like oxidoreductase
LKIERRGTADALLPRERGETIAVDASQRKAEMEYRTLGRTGLNMSVLGLGGHVYPVGPNGFRTHDERAQLVARLIEGGVNYFDTTWLNEAQLLADSFRRLGAGRNCHVSLQYVDGISDSRWRERLRGELESRLEAMGYSRAPLFLMGVGNGYPPLSEIVAALEALAALKDEGLIENIGVSCHELSRFDALADAIEKTDLVDYMMIRYNFKFPQAAERLFPCARERNVGIVAMKAFCWDCGPDQWGRRISVFEPVEAEGRSAPRAGASPAQQSLRWVLRNPAVSTTVPAMNALWEVEQNLDAAKSLGAAIDSQDFASYADRLWDREALRRLAENAESETIRERAAALMK